MKKQEFANWLSEKKQMSKRTISSRVSNVTRIDSAYDIDVYYANERIEDLLDQFDYSKNDQKEGKEPRASIEIDGDYYTGIATLKMALKLYIEFLDDTKIVKYITSEVNTSKFSGSLKDFMDLLGPRCRNIVQQIAKKERSDCNGICEYCHRKSELQSAHRAGEERPKIINGILEKHYKIGDDRYDVPLREFESLFKKAHLPIRDHIYFLCKDCHNAYDVKKTLNDQMILAERDMMS